MKFKQTKERQLQIVRDKYSGGKIEDKVKYDSYFKMSYLGFEQEMYKKTIDIAVHAAMSYHYLPGGLDANAPIKTQFISIDSIFMTLGFRSDGNKARNMQQVEEAINRLESAGLFTIEYIYDKPSRNRHSDLFQVTFSLSKGTNHRGDADFETNKYIRVDYGAFMHLQRMDVSSSTRIGLIASYIAIIRRGFGYVPHNSIKKDKDGSPQYDKNGNFIVEKFTGPTPYTSVLNAVQRPVNFASLEDTAKSACISRNSMMKYLDILIEDKLIAYYKIQYEGHSDVQWKYLLSRYEDAFFLRAYLIQLIENRSQLRAEGKQKHYVINVWDEEIDKITK